MTRKKIGILTFINSINYGSVLQAYALERTLNKNNEYDVEIIDYMPNNWEKIYSLYEECSSIKKILVNIIRRLPAKKYYYYRNIRFEEFKNLYFKLSKVKYNSQNASSIIDNNYFAIICGSDQIWNVHALDCDDVFFLPYKMETVKIAYSISLNNTNFEEKRCDETLKESIDDFKYISLREESGCKKLKKFLNRNDIKCTIDPTFFISKNEYKEIENKVEILEPYIFLFSVNFSDDVIKVAKHLSNKYNLKIYSVLTNKKSYKYVNNKQICILYDRLSPLDFLSYIDNAKYVVTNSFHGTAFSIIYEKRFISVNEKNSNGINKNDERIYNILHKLDLLDRFVSVDEIDNFNINNEIDYVKVNDLKNIYVLESKKFIEQSLKGHED